MLGSLSNPKGNLTHWKAVNFKVLLNKFREQNKANNISTPRNTKIISNSVCLASQDGGVMV